MASFVSEINDRLSMVDKRIDEIDPNWAVENKHTLYPLPENAGTSTLYLHVQLMALLWCHLEINLTLPSETKYLYGL